MKTFLISLLVITAGVVHAQKGGTMVNDSSAVPVTFQADMGYQITLGQFNTDGSDHIEVQSGFNLIGTWGGNELTNVPGTTLYQNTFDITSPSPGSVVEYKFHIWGTHDTWESLGWYPNGNRRFTLASSEQILPTAYFSDAWAGSSGIVVYVQVDMSAQVGAGNFVPGSDTAEAQGAFNNNWGAFSLTNDPSASNPNLYSGAYVETVRAPGTRIEYKFHTYGIHDAWESIVGYPDKNRSFILSDVSPQVLPAAYFSDTSGSPIWAGVYFQLDLSSQIVVNAFNPTQDIASVRGDAMGWGDPPGSGLQLFADASRPGIYTNTWLTTNQVTGAAFLYKNAFFRTNPPYAVWEIGDNKSVTFTGSEPVNADGYHIITVGPALFDDFYANPKDYLAADTLVTFSVSMTNAVGTDSHTFDPSADSVYINGDFLGWPAWNTSLPQLINDPVGSGIYQIQLAIPKGNPVSLTYRYSINGSDNEAGYAINHVRYIRQVGIYSLPLDTFGTMLQETASPPTVSVNSATICVGSSATLVATTSASSPSYLWSPGGAATASITVSPSSTTTYTVTVTDGTTGCTNGGSGAVTVNPQPTVSVNSVGICAGGSATLTATTGASSPSYLWNPGGATTASITVSPSSTTTYTVTVTDGTTGCTNGGSGTVTVNPQPTVSVNSVGICAGGSATLTAATGASSPSYLWSPGEATTASITVSPSSTTTYTVTVTDGTTGCTNGGSGAVTVNPLPTAAAGSDQTVCTNSPVGIGGNPTASGGTGPYTYSWAPAAGLSDTTAANPTATVGSTTTYRVTVTDANGCTGVASVVLTVVPRTTRRFYRIVEISQRGIIKPLVLAPPIVIGSITRSGTVVTLVWSSQPGATYRVQYKNDLTGASWTDLAGDVTATGVTATKTDPVGGCP